MHTILENERKNDILKKWKIFMENQKKTEPYTIVCPPPNVTGDLHLGHCVTFTYIDTIGRYQILRGKKLYMEGGTDHASIATTIMVRKHYKDLLTEENFQEKAQEWIENSQNKIKQQLWDLGVLMDWENFCYTFDAIRSQEVIKAFNIFYKKGLIFKAKKMVNWDNVFSTAISDLEVKMIAEEGIMYHVPYCIMDGSDKIIVATTRPETIFADCALAIHPEDPRASQLKGKKVKIPLTNRIIPIILSEKVEKDFGTGILKITPAHSLLDYEIWENHPEIKNLEPIDLMDGKGIIVGPYVPQEFIGLNVKQARKLMETLLNLEGVKIKHSVPYSDRSGTVIESKITEQWFFDVGPFAQEAIEIVEKKHINFVPEILINNYKSWLKNLQIWCISRDLPLGHQIPIWYDTEGNSYCAHNHQEALEKAKANKPSHDYDANPLLQEKFTLDTWFSSGLFHRSVLDFHKIKENINGSDLFPAELVVTGDDILFFWITRMILMSVALQEGDLVDKVAFKNVIFHGMVRDKMGQKISKTKGNSINPYEISDTYGFDNLRLTLLLNSHSNQDLRLNSESFITTKRILTKLHNANLYCSKFMKNFQDNNLDLSQLSLQTSPIAYGLMGITAKFIKKYFHLMDSLAINKAVKIAVNDFFYGTFCDKFIEIHKHLANLDPMADVVMTKIFQLTLKMLHPQMPFVTEEIWNTYYPEDFSILQNNLENFNAEPNTLLEDTVESITDVISLIRFFQKVFLCKNLGIFRELQNQEEVVILKQSSIIITSITGTQWIEGEEGIIKYRDNIGNLWILSGILLEPLLKAREIDKLQKKIAKLKNDLDNPEFLRYASGALVEQYNSDLSSTNMMLQCILQCN